MFREYFQMATFGRSYFQSAMSQFYSDNCQKNSWTKTLQSSGAKYKCPCLIGIFSDGKTLELLTVSVSFEEQLQQKLIKLQQNICLWNCSVCALFWQFHVQDSVPTPFFLLYCHILLPRADYRMFFVLFFLFILFAELSHPSCVIVTQGLCNILPLFELETSLWCFLQGHRRPILVNTLCDTHFSIAF